VAAAIGLGAAANPGVFPALFGGVAPLDSTRYVVLASGAVDAPPGIGPRVADRLYDAFREWEGLPLVTDTRVKQAVANGRSLLTESDALALARDLGAGKLVWGQASGTDRDTRVRLHLYDVATGESRDEFVLVDSTGAERPYSHAAARLLKNPDRPRSADGGDDRTKSFGAWSAYARGHVALHEWALADAEAHFRAAVTHDPAYSPARVWLAQVLAWNSGYGRGDWQAQTARAIAESKTLAPRELSIASGLAALAAQDFPRACRSFADLTRADSLDFVGWHGLGECQYLDSLVVRNPASPSRWRFRSSYHAAALSYMRALRTEPGAHAVVSFERLKRLLPTATTQVRSGKGPPPARAFFVGYPELLGDSVVFIPYPFEEFQNRPSVPSTRTQALEYGAKVLRDFAQDWVRQSPRSPQAFEALADVLETSGELAEDDAGRMSALSALRQSRAFASTPEERVRVATREVWVNLKSSRFREARTLADSILDGKITSGALDPVFAIGVAALSGRVEKTAQFSRTSREWLPALDTDLHVSVASAAARYFAYAALGVCGPALEAAERGLDEKLDSYVADRNKAAVRDALKERPLSMAAHCDDAASSLRIRAPGSRISRMQQAHARNDRRTLLVRLDSAIADARTMRPADLSFDYTYQLAWLRAASGDTVGALKQLQLALGALPSVSTISLRQGAVAAATVRAMILCADLASATGDHKTAQYWAQAVTTLWSRADPSLAPTVNRMRSLAAARSSS
jgi:hypothetical protein